MALKGLFNFFSCQHYTELASRGIDEELRGWDKVRFRFHHVICTFCRRARRQMLMIERGLKRLTEGEEGSVEPLSAAAKDRILRKLQGGEGDHRIH